MNTRGYAGPDPGNLVWGGAQWEVGGLAGCRASGASEKKKFGVGLPITYSIT